MSTPKMNPMAPVHNPDLEKVINDLKEGSTVEKQQALVVELQKAKFLSPCMFDVNMEGLKPNQLKNVHPSEIRFYMMNMQDGKTLFPVFTDLEYSNKVKFGQDEKPQYIVRTIIDYDHLFQSPITKADGLVINPGKDNIVIPKNLVAICAGRNPHANKQPKQQPIQYRYGEPSAYPTQMVNAMYECCEKLPAVNKVWLKAKFGGNEMSFFIVVKMDREDQNVLKQLSEAAEPHAKNVRLEFVYDTDAVEKNIIKDAVPFYDRDLQL